MVAMIFVICFYIVDSRNKNTVWLDSTRDTPESSY